MNKPAMTAAFESAKSRLEYLIMATPTGPIREKLTEANLHLMDAERQFRELAKAAEQA